MSTQPTAVVVSDSAGFGGSELYLATLASELRARWRFVALLGDRAPTETRRRLSEAGAEIRVVPGLRRIPDARAVASLVRALRRINPQVAHVNLTDQGDGAGPLLACRLARCRTVATLHLVIPGRAAWRELISRHTLRLPHAVIGVSSFVAAWAEGAGARARPVLNGVSPSEQTPGARGLLGLPAEALVVGGIGRLDVQKGWDVLCRAARIVRNELPDVLFAVIGDGPEAPTLREAEACREVRFLGYREGASTLLAAFDILVVPSRYEAFGMVAAEAMLAGVPVVATNVGGLLEVVGEGGVVVPPESPEHLAAAIVALIRDPAARHAAVEPARRRARSLFSTQRMADETADIYASVAGNGAVA
ncbi:MAG: hypothetical protein C5B48_04760 [Candidatus Rokuibacteriota bacterium]|nr:MAG: hypothetical protein C5B48_04760 [Candidatus Rokubacteria bacterium]